MNLKGMLRVSTSLMVVCAGFMSSFAQAEDYVTQSQVNAANGVAGLNASKQVTADINNSKISTNDITIQGQSVSTAMNKANLAIPGQLEPISAYNSDSNSPLVFMSKWGYDNGNIKPNTLMIGGNTRNSIVGIKATCQNTGGGDLGGSCYQFTNMSGRQTNHRGGAGLTDGINMDIRNTDNSPVDVIGGNTLVKNEDGTYSAEGNNYSVAAVAAAGATTFKIKGTFGCGIGDGQSRCEMTGVNVVNSQGTSATTIKVTPGTYDVANDTTIVKLPANYQLQDKLSVSDTVNIKFYSADGVAYAIGFVKEKDSGGYMQHEALIAPVLSSKEAALISPRMAVWTNIADGMYKVEGGSNEDDSNIDMPNYYYGYNEWVAADTKRNVSVLAIQTTYYPNTGDTKFGWRTFKNSNSGNSSNPRFDFLGDKTVAADGSSTSNQYDYTLDYTNPGTKKTQHNSNYHRYSQPALFLGLNNKSFNLYGDQKYEHAPDSITREFGSEFDFVMPTNNKGAVVSRGLTLGWSGTDTDNYAKGSYMMRLHGGQHMPMGLWVSGVWPYGGKTISTDAGFFVFNNSLIGTGLSKVNDLLTASALGQVKVDSASYQLFNYASKDGAANNSLHLGLTKGISSNAFASLNQNESPTCVGTDKQTCSVLGQVIFDPLGYVGGIALGSGQGENTKLGLIVDAASNVIVNNQLTLAGQSVNDAVTKANSSIQQSQVNVANGVAGLNASKQVTADIMASSIYGSTLRGNMLNINKPSTDTAIYPVRFNTGSSDTNNGGVDIFYNSKTRTDGWGNSLDANTLYFTNHHHGLDVSYDNASDRFNQYKFEGRVTTTQKISAPIFQGNLSTPASSTASCTAGEFKDDTNYHYVCVDTNKWKRVALSDF